MAKCDFGIFSGPDFQMNPIEGTHFRLQLATGATIRLLPEELAVTKM
jgi:hypothetical protein